VRIARQRHAGACRENPWISQQPPAWRVACITLKGEYRRKKPVAKLEKEKLAETACQLGGSTSGVARIL
jgi:hypothetical protein